REDAGARRLVGPAVQRGAVLRQAGPVPPAADGPVRTGGAHGIRGAPHSRRLRAGTVRGHGVARKGALRHRNRPYGSLAARRDSRNPGAPGPRPPRTYPTTV